MSDRTEEFLRSAMQHDTAPIRAGEDFWAKAVNRGRRLRRRRRRNTWLGVGVTAAASVIAAGALADRSDESVPDPAGPTAVDSPPASPDANRHGPIVLDSIELDDGRRLELRAWGRPAGGGPCLQFAGLEGRIRQCGYAPSGREPPVREAIGAEAVAQRTDSAPLEVYGATSADVTSVVVHYESGDQQRQQRASLLRCTDEATLDEAGISEPFGFFFAELPPDTVPTAVQADAFGPNGELLGSTDFSRIGTMPLRVFIGGPSQR